MIDANAFRRIRRRVMKNIAPEFSERKGISTRQTAEGQVHCIQFTAATWANGFCVDMGFHFVLLPSFEAFALVPRPEHPEPQTCCLKRRWRNSALQQGFPYGDSVDDAEQLVTEIVNHCLHTFDSLTSLWGNGEPLLDRLPPEVLAADAVIFKQLYDCPDPQEQGRLSDTMTIRSLFPGWDPGVSPMCIMLAHLARVFRNSEGLLDYLAVTKAPGQHQNKPSLALIADLKSRAR